MTFIAALCASADQSVVTDVSDGYVIGAGGMIRGDVTLSRNSSRRRESAGAERALDCGGCGAANSTRVVATLSPKGERGRTRDATKRAMPMTT